MKESKQLRITLLVYNFHSYVHWDVTVIYCLSIYILLCLYLRVRLNIKVTKIKVIEIFVLHLTKQSFCVREVTHHPPRPVYLRKASNKPPFLLTSNVAKLNYQAGHFKLEMVALLEVENLVET